MALSSPFLLFLLLFLLHPAIHSPPSLLHPVTTSPHPQTVTCTHTHKYASKIRVNRLFFFWVDSYTGLGDFKRCFASWTWAEASPRLQCKQIRQSPDRSWLHQTADNGGRRRREEERERGMHGGRKRARRRDDYQRIRGM